MDKKQALNQAIDQQLAEVQKMREAKRQIVASHELGQLILQLQEGISVPEAQVEQVIRVLTSTIREPLEERIAFQEEQINYLKQQVEYLTNRVTGPLWS